MKPNASPLSKGEGSGERFYIPPTINNISSLFRAEKPIQLANFVAFKTDKGQPDWMPKLAQK